MQFTVLSLSLKLIQMGISYNEILDIHVVYLYTNNMHIINHDLVLTSYLIQSKYQT